MNAKAPTFQIEKISKNPSYPGMFLVSFRCPNCREWHMHGWNGEDRSPAHRAAHCWDPHRKHMPHGYNIQVPEDMRIPK